MTVSVRPGGSPDPPTPARGCLLPSSALPPTGHRDPPPPPLTHREPPGLRLEVAAVAVGPGHPAAGTSRRSGRRQEAAAVPDTPAPLELRQLPITRLAPRGARTAQAAGPGAEVLGLRGLDGCASFLTPAPRAGLVPLPPSSGKGHPDIPLWASPVGQTPFTYRNQFPSLGLLNCELIQLVSRMPGRGVGGRREVRSRGPRQSLFCTLRVSLQGFITVVPPF